MKKFLIFLFGVILGVAGYIFYQRTQHPTVSQQADATVDATKDKAGEIKDVVVEKSKVVGDKMDDARIITMIKGKYVLDKELSVLAISVSCRGGHVTLTGSVESAGLADKAERLARETSGVASVSSQLTVKS
jgi:osmotically-inducible protein OsmY